MLTSENIRSVICHVVLGFDVSSLSDNQQFKDVGIDSLEHINILLELEEQYGCRIPDDKVNDCDSIAGILQYLNR